MHVVDDVAESSSSGSGDPVHMLREDVVCCVCGGEGGWNRRPYPDNENERKDDHTHVGHESGDRH